MYRGGHLNEVWGQGLNKSDGEGDGEEKSIPLKRDACVRG